MSSGSHAWAIARSTRSWVTSASYVAGRRSRRTCATRARGPADARQGARTGQAPKDAIKGALPDSDERATGERGHEATEGADVVDVVGDGDVLVRRVIRGGGVARAEARDRNAELVAHQRHRPRSGEQRIDHRFRDVGRATCVDGA